MSPTEDLRYKIIDQLIDNNVRFALYQLPQSKGLHLVMQNTAQSHTYQHIEELNGQKGFVIAPFHTSVEFPIAIIEPEIVLDGENTILDYLTSTSCTVDKTYNIQHSINRGLDNYITYQQVFNKFHTNVVENKLQKLVLSRTLDITHTNSLGLAFKRAIDKYSDNFVYLCHTPETGTWLGSSPEILLSGNKQNWKTDALAGTQKVSMSTENIVWDEKNIYEQDIVMQYMEGQLSKIGITSVKDEPKTILSGDLAHLKSEYRFQLPDLNKVGNILDILHPTPAICGFPKSKALDFIIQNEGYKRAYYSGFIGVLNPEDKTNLYVNLRCAQALPNAMRLYAGGGIMPDSQAQNEWQETEYKLQTILSIL